MFAQCSVAGDRGWDGREWTCLDNLWSNVSDFEQSTDGDTQGIPGATPPSSQIPWALDYISAEHGTPCVAWAQWENSRSC